MRFSLFLLLLLLLPRASSAQTLTIASDFTAEQLIRDVFASGQCETISNIRQIGSNPAGIGFFSGPDSIVGFGRGIILSTGDVAAARGPNSDTDVGSELQGDVADPDLDLASTGNVFDASGISFDFIPLQPTVTFRYVFASEEYCEFVGADFNDIFGFFVSGPGINGPFSNGAVNLALIPGTNQPVSINSVNFDRNAQFYLDNEFPAVRRAANCGGGTTVSPRFSAIEYDGQTVILTASIDLQICQTYQIRLVVGDVQDGRLDSAVFLEAGSFDLGGSVTLEPEDTTRATVLLEGCAPTSFRVQRGPDSDPVRPQTIAYRIGGNSTAEEGVDFTAGTGSVTIPTGASFAEIPLQAFDDGVVEGRENAWLFLDIPCACYTDSIELFIDEPSALEVGLEEAFYCPDETATLRPAVSGGARPYAYQWSFGSTDSVPRLTPPLPPTVQLTVTDACGQREVREIATFSNPPPSLRLPPQTLQACRNAPQEIQLDLTGAPPLTISYTLNAGPVETWRFDQDGRVAAPVSRGGNFRILAIEDQACRVDLDETVRVDFFQPVINPRLTNPSCAGESDGAISVTHLPTLPPYQYEWVGVNPLGLTADSLPAGAYSLRVTDALGCSDQRDLSLRDPDRLLPIDITCNQVRRPPLVVSASGGRPPYEYSINGREYFTAEQFADLEEGRFYRLRIRDVAGCMIEQENFFWPRAIRRPARLPNFVPQELAGSARVVPDYFVPRDQILAYQWSPATLFDCTDCPSPTVSAPRSQVVSLVLENIYGCRDSLVTTIAVDGRVPIYVPNIFRPNGDGNNDLVVVYANLEQVARIQSFRVFNRWGAELWAEENFAPNDPRRGWDGVINGQPGPSATYVWVAEVLLTTGEVQSASGTVVLMR